MALKGQKFAGREGRFTPAQGAMPLNMESDFHAGENLHLERG